MNAFDELTQHLTGWIRWRRIRRGLTWGLRGLTLGLFLALLWGTAGLGQGWFVAAEFAAFVTLLTLAVTLVTSLGAVFWPLSHLQAARDFDRAFGLRERISTALELHRSPGLVPDELRQRQLEDALAAARTVTARRDLPLRIRPLEMLLPLTLVLLLGVVYSQGERYFQAAQQARDVQKAIQEQVETIEQLLQTVENNPSLSEEQKKALAAPLQQALNDLNQNPGLESSVSTLVSAGEKLQALNDPQAAQTVQALQQTGTQLAKQEGSPLQSVGEQLANGNPIAAASELANLDLSQLSPEQAAQLAGQLQQMAQSVASSNPQLAQQLNQAAQALQNGEPAAAQQALSQAAQTMAQTGQAQAMNQAASQAAGQMQQGAGQVIAAGGGQNAGQTAASSSQASSGQGAGSGAGTGENPNAQSGQAGTSPIPQNNQPGNGGETSYEQIYAPNLLGGEGGPQVGLNSGSGQEGEVIGQGPTTPGGEGQNLVPYTDVFGRYEEVNRRAIESGQIPFEFAQIIRSYFDSLKP
ncbi:MAG: hypothetical protein Fur0016_17750 [Anaerolineales bacterium]